MNVQSLKRSAGIICSAAFFLFSGMVTDAHSQALSRNASSSGGACKMPVHFTTYGSGIVVDFQTGGPVCLHCDEITLSCDDGNQLTPDCVLHLPTDGDGSCIGDYETGDVLKKRDLQKLLKDLRKLYDDLTTYGEALLVCITAHELIHATHSTTGAGILACESEEEAFEESIKCFKEVLENCSGEDCEQLEEELQRQNDGRLYNKCLCQNHPSRVSYPSSEPWEDTCEACKRMQGCVNCHDEWTESYCEVNDPANPWIIG